MAPILPASSESIAHATALLREGKLVAMAGERLKIPGYTEVSAVCTHPEARGRGYAAALMSTVMEEIRAHGKTPMLHSFAHNANAIAVYKSLGFTRRRSFELAVLRNHA